MRISETAHKIDINVHEKGGNKMQINIVLAANGCLPLPLGLRHIVETVIGIFTPVLFLFTIYSCKTVSEQK